ncbi:MAG: phosphoenolpyruvate--protein phosphotransferase [Thermoguttaceae bacterium]
MKTISGIPASPGIGFGKAFIQNSERFRVLKHLIDPNTVVVEVERFFASVQLAKEEIEHNRDSARNALGTSFGDIFEAQLQVLHDTKLQDDMANLIRVEFFSAERAVKTVMARHADILRKIPNSYISEKVNDLVDIEKRLLRHLLGVQKDVFAASSEPIILLAANLTPSETAALDRKVVRGIVTEEGGLGGHTAILASALEIPCVVGAGRFLEHAHSGEMVFIDGESGQVVFSPDEKTQKRFHTLRDSNKVRTANLQSLQFIEPITKDGVRISIHANIEFPHEAAGALERGADGIGLFRTEFLYLTQKDVSSEEEHFEAYKSAIDAMQGKPVVIRTFDFGGDKVSDQFGDWVNAEHNPALGLRGIRLALKQLPLFQCQLRAILRASAFGDVRIMFPLISTVKEFRQAKRTILRDVMEELREKNTPFNENIPVGMMVEVPSAVILLHRFVSDADFFSIGTNDLIQYTMAVDRGNRNVNHLFHAEDPAVLRLIYRTVTVAGHHSIPVSLCGQMGASPLHVVLLLGLGLRSVSCAPNAIPRVKQVCNAVSIDDCREIAKRALALVNAKDVQDYVHNRLKKIAPDLFKS